MFSFRAAPSTVDSTISNGVSETFIDPESQRPVKPKRDSWFSYTRVVGGLAAIFGLGAAGSALAYFSSRSSEAGSEPATASETSAKGSATDVVVAESAGALTTSDSSSFTPASVGVKPASRVSTSAIQTSSSHSGTYATFKRGELPPEPVLKLSAHEQAATDVTSQTQTKLASRVAHKEAAAKSAFTTQSSTSGFSIDNNKIAVGPGQTTNIGFNNFNFSIPSSVNPAGLEVYITGTSTGTTGYFWTSYYGSGYQVTKFSYNDLFHTYGRFTATNLAPTISISLSCCSPIQTVIPSTPTTIIFGNAPTILKSTFNIYRNVPTLFTNTSLLASGTASKVIFTISINGGAPIKITQAQVNSPGGTLPALSGTATPTIKVTVANVGSLVNVTVTATVVFHDGSSTAPSILNNLWVLTLGQPMQVSFNQMEFVDGNGVPVVNATVLISGANGISFTPLGNPSVTTNFFKTPASPLITNYPVMVTATILTPSFSFSATEGALSSPEVNALVSVQAPPPKAPYLASPYGDLTAYVGSTATTFNGPVFIDPQKGTLTLMARVYMANVPFGQEALLPAWIKFDDVNNVFTITPVNAATVPVWFLALNPQTQLNGSVVFNVNAKNVPGGGGGGSGGVSSDISVGTIIGGIVFVGGIVLYIYKRKNNKKRIEGFELKPEGSESLKAAAEYDYEVARPYSLVLTNIVHFDAVLRKGYTNTVCRDVKSAMKYLLAQIKENEGIETDIREMFKTPQAEDESPKHDGERIDQMMDFVAQSVKQTLEAKKSSASRCPGFLKPVAAFFSRLIFPPTEPKDLRTYAKQIGEKLADMVPKAWIVKKTDAAADTAATDEKARATSPRRSHRGSRQVVADVKEKDLPTLTDTSPRQGNEGVSETDDAASQSQSASVEMESVESFRAAKTKGSTSMRYSKGSTLSGSKARKAEMMAKVAADAADVEAPEAEEGQVEKSRTSRSGKPRKLQVQARSSADDGRSDSHSEVEGEPDSPGGARTSQLRVSVAGLGSASTS